MRERFIGIVGAAGCVSPHTKGPDGRLHGNSCIVEMAGIRLPTKRIPVCVEHEREFVVGFADWCELGPDMVLRVRGEVNTVIARAFGGSHGCFAMSWYLQIEEAVPFVGGMVNGSRLYRSTLFDDHLVTRSRLVEVSVVRLPVDARCYGRLLHANDPPHLFAAGTAGRASDGRAHPPRIAPAVIRAAAGKGTLPTFSGCAYTGAPMKPHGWGAPVVVDLDGVKVPSQHRPVLRQHDHEQLVGHTTSVSVHPKRGIEVEGVFSGERHHVAKVVEPARNGFEWQLSVGANPLRTEYLQAGEEDRVNGRTVTGPLTISRETELGEVSFVALGADQATSVHVVAQPGRRAIAGASR